MTRHAQTARDTYLTSLSSADELAMRHAAEKSGVPDDDPLWLLLAEVRRACSDVAQSTMTLQNSVTDAAHRIEHATMRDARTPAFADSYISQIADTAGASIAKDPQLVNVVANAIRQVESDATRALRTIEASIRELMRRRSATPISSLTFACALGITSCCAAVWGGYHSGFAYGHDLGYRAGFHDARLYDRSHQ